MAEECVGFHSYFWHVHAKWGFGNASKISDFRSTQPTIFRRITTNGSSGLSVGMKLATGRRVCPMSSN